MFEVSEAAARVLVAVALEGAGKEVEEGVEVTRSVELGIMDVSNVVEGRMVVVGSITLGIEAITVGTKGIEGLIHRISARSKK